MQFKLRKSGDYANCWLVDGSATLDFGFIDNKEGRQLLESFKDAVDELEWFVNATDKNEPPPSQ